MAVVEVKVIPKAKRNLIKDEGSRLKAYITAAPEKGRANKALIELLSLHFDVPKKNISIIKGLHSQVKTVKIC